MDPRKQPPGKKKIGEHQIGETRFNIYHSRWSTLTEIDRVSDQVVTRAFRSLVPDAPGTVSIDEKRDVVKGEVQIAWYQARGRGVPDKAVANQRVRIEETRMAPKQKAEKKTAQGSKKARRYVKDVITEGLLEGLEDDEIIHNVHNEFPNSKAGKADVAYYRSKLRKSGDLPPYQRKTKVSDE